MDRAALSAWIEAYELAWRTAGTAALAEVFAPEVTYSFDPYAAPVVGLDALGRWWDDNQEGADEVFEMHSEIVAVDGDTGVVRVEVTYG